MSAYKFVAKDLMTEKVVCVHPETTINNLIKLLVKNKIHGVPVVDKKGIIVGVVSTTDIVEYDEKRVRRQGLLSKKSFYTDMNGKLKKTLDRISKLKNFGKAVVKDIMTTNVIVAQSTDTIDKLAKIMYDNRIHRIIIQNKKHVIGIVSSFDILRAVSTMGYGSNAFVTEEAILDMREQLESIEASIQSIRDITNKIQGEK